jgi:predicted nuclease with TOPRIM domain
VRLTEDMTQIKTAISSIGTFNAQKKKEEILQKLNTWMPLYNSFQAQLEPFKRQIQEAQEDNSYLHKKVEDQSWAVQGHKVRADDLQRQLWEYQEFVESIPEELRVELQQRFEEMQEQEQSFYE